MRLEERVQKRRRARWDAKLFTQIELSGLLAIIFVLLIAFMMSPDPGRLHFAVDLAAANNSGPKPDAQKEDAIIVWIACDGSVYFRNYKLSRNDIPRAIQDAVQGGAEPKVYVKADARARYSDVETVIDAIRRSGVSNVVFLTKSPSQPLIPTGPGATQ